MNALVVTGIVQEFRSGTNWSNYSAFVGDLSDRRWPPPSLQG